MQTLALASENNSGFAEGAGTPLWIVPLHFHPCSRSTLLTNSTENAPNSQDTLKKLSLSSK